MFLLKSAATSERQRGCRVKDKNRAESNNEAEARQKRELNRDRSTSRGKAEAETETEAPKRKRRRGTNRQIPCNERRNARAETRRKIKFNFPVHNSDGTDTSGHYSSENFGPCVIMFDSLSVRKQTCNLKPFHVQILLNIMITITCNSIINKIGFKRI